MLGMLSGARLAQSIDMEQTITATYVPKRPPSAVLPGMIRIMPKKIRERRQTVLVKLHLGLFLIWTLKLRTYFVSDVQI